jgi:penicillin-binding protein-related factor A (putative recombinase)
MASNRLEIAFDLGYRKFLQNQYFLINEADVPTYRKPKQTVDRILVSKRLNIALELKQTKRKLISFRRFQDHQVQELIEFKQKAGEAYFLVSLNEFRTVALIDIDQFKTLRQKLTKKSFNESDLTLIDHKIIRAEKLRTNYRLSLTFLLPDQMLLSSYI